MKLEPQDFDILKPFIKESIVTTLTELSKKEFEKKIFNIKQASGLLGKSRNWVSDRMKNGTFITTSDGEYISGKEINRYLGLNA